MEAFLTLVWFLAGATAGWWLTSLRLARTASLGREQMRTQMYTAPMFLSALGIPAVDASCRTGLLALTPRHCPGTGKTASECTGPAVVIGRPAVR
jgi:hypothetical protein